MSFKEFIYFNKKKVFFVFVCIVVLVVILIFNLYDQDKLNIFNDDVEVDVELDKEEEIEKKEEEQDNLLICFFDIKGEVVKPGVYSIECNKRVIDAINISGGLTKNSDTSVLNLSKKVEDSMVIFVYSKKEVNDYLNSLKKQEEKESICGSANIKNDACINNNVSNNSNNKLVNINSATLEELMVLPGIGESKARNIISYRQNNPFKKIDDILNVEGIGESLYASIKESITV